tara:strand:+ start:236 stop:451 length:216 start_codon:yes stop_codon:yes gene_type:complete
MDLIFNIWFWLGLGLLEMWIFGTNYMIYPISIVLFVLLFASFIGITKFGLNWRGHKRGSSVYDYDSDDVDL